jgi:microcompartment protein CcmK/EutM
MIPALVVGNAVSSHCHPSLKGCKMLVCQPLDPAGNPGGSPMIAIDLFGVSTDGIGARHIVHDEKSPVRNFIQGVID